MSEAEVVFSLPSRLDIDGAVHAAHSLKNLPEVNLYRLDFSNLKFVEPFGMIYFAIQLRQFRQANPQRKFKAEHYKNHGYAAHMGFFKTFGLDFGNDPGEASGSIQYVPITCLTLSDLEREASSQYEDERETIERRSMTLASVLVRQDDGPLHETLSYSLREIFRNVFEHSEADVIWYAAQYWPENGWVELCVLDEGLGIRASLERNPHLTINSDLDALQLAMLPGISGVAFKGGPKQRKDAWANSGYGLFMTSQLCQRGGSFAIISGQGGVQMQSDVQSQFACSFHGTAIRMKFYVPQIAELNKALEELRHLGADIAGTLKQSANITASMSSRMLIGNNNGINQGLCRNKRK